MEEPVDEPWLSFVGVSPDFRAVIEDGFTSDGLLVGDSVEKLAHRVGARVVLVVSTALVPNLDVVRQLVAEPNAYTIALADRSATDSYLELMRAGASGVADVDSGVEHIATVTAAALRHDFLLPAAVVRTLLDRPDPVRLSDTSIQILQCLERGMNTKQIAASLNVSGRTARRRIHNLYLQLGVTDAAAAVRRANQHGWVDGATEPPSSPDR